MAPHAWRFAYQWMILTPGVGYRLHRSGKFIPKVLVGRLRRRRVSGTSATVHAFSDIFTQPARARAAVQVYRVFNLGEPRDHARPLL